tara:strand:+ start:91 stop:306 length:216 start_codon:yes stop_codon:yes gene_type:complete
MTTKEYTSEMLLEILKLCRDDYLHTYAFDDNDTKGKTFQELEYDNKVLKSMTYKDMYDLLTEHIKYLESEQ